MKAGVLTKAEQIEIQEIPMASIEKDTDVIVKVKAIGICGTDLHVYRGERDDVEFPRIMGHELAGVVTDTGMGVTRVRKGDHVILDPVIACHTCETCKKGHENVCEQVKCFGVQCDGGFQEYISVDENYLYTVPKEIPFKTAALGEPFSIAANILDKVQVTAGDHVVIFGAGTIGMAVLQAVKRTGCQVMITDISQKKLKTAEDFGADAVVNTSQEDLQKRIEAEFNDQVDVIIDAVGIAATLETAVKIASPCARIVVIGFDKRKISFAPSDITRREIQLLGSRMNNRKFPQVVEWLKEGVITDRMISKIYSLNEIDQAFQDTLKHNEDWLKTMIVMED